MTGKCGSVRIRLIPAIRGTSIVAAARRATSISTRASPATQPSWATLSWPITHSNYVKLGV